MKSFIFLTLTLLIAFSIGAQEPMQFNGNIQIQGTKSFKDGPGGNNLDELWGRINLGGTFKDSVWESKFNIRIFPAGFGFDPIVGATYDTTHQGIDSVQKSPESRVVVTDAWVASDFGLFRSRLGRIETSETMSMVFGNYIDQNPGALFKSRLANHNAIEFLAKSGNMNSSAMLGVTDRFLNKGFIRFYERWAILPTLNLSFGFKTNFPDRVYEDGVEILNRIVIGGDYSYGSVTLFGEGAWLQQAQTSDPLMPITLGTQIKLHRYLDRLAFEAEIVPDRIVPDQKFGTKDKVVLLHIGGSKKIFNRLNFEGSLYSDEKGYDFVDLKSSLRVTGNLK